MESMDVRGVCVFDEETLDRFERERRQTRKGLRALRACRRIYKRELYKTRVENLRNEKESREKSNGKAENVESTSIEKQKRYKLTNLSKLRRLRWQKEEEAREKCFAEYERKKFFDSLIELKSNLSNEKWNYYCHLKERLLQREDKKLKNIMRIRWEYKIEGVFPADKKIIDKIIKLKRERKKQMKMRKERMVKIIEKLSREMRNGVRILEKPKIEVKETLSDLGEASECHYQSPEECASIIEEKIEKELETEVKKNDDEREEQLGESEESPKEIDGSKHISLNKAPTFKISFEKYKKSSAELPGDTYFCANPNVVTFEDFKLDRKYSRKVIITNKSPKLAYLRFNEIKTEIWEPGVFEIDAIDAAKIRPGLHVTINVKFSPSVDVEMAAEISFFTLGPDDSIFHDFRIPVRCSPGIPIPVLEPREIRFPTAPIWKYGDSKFTEKVLTVSNDGGKSFSLVLEKRDPFRDCFLWEFVDGDVESVVPSILNFSENEKDLGKGDRKKCRIEVPSRVKCRLRINFRPRYVGLHHEVFEICFMIGEEILEKQSIPLWAEVTGSKIHLDPPCVDLGIVIIDSEVCQQNFDIVNDGKSSVDVAIKTPRRLENQVTVHPKSLTIQPETIRTISVRFIPESNIIKISKGYYDSTSNMLEFPIHVETLAKDDEKPPPLILKILANLTTSHALILQPLFINLGRVHTHESVSTDITVTNVSLVTQDFGVVNLPSSMEIQPNYGFGTIFPGETVTLNLIYSASLADVPGNEVGESSVTGERRFQIRFSTLAELAGKKKRVKVHGNKDLSKLPLNYGVPPSSPVEQKSSEEINFEHLFDDRGTDFREKKDMDATINPMKSIDGTMKRREKNIVEVLAYIVDTFCEFSEQIIEFPATPCSSFSMVSIDLRGFNMASHRQCTCGILKSGPKEFTASYEFKCSSDRVEILPRSGFLRSNDLVKVTFIFHPKLSRSKVLARAVEISGKVEENSETVQEKSSGKSKRKGKSSGKEKKVEIEENSEFENYQSELSLLETFEPRVSTIFVTCEMQIETANGTRDEQLFAKLICPITRPEFLILNVEREIDFGVVAIGNTGRKIISVKNIYNSSVKVHVSLLNPFGPFSIAPGKLVETGSVLELPVTYRPMEDHQGPIEEYFEISSPRTGTIWGLTVKGQAVVPSWSILPVVRVARFETQYGKLVELKMTIENTGVCPLTFRLLVVDVLGGDIPAVEQDSSRAGKTGKTGKTKGKRRGKQEFSDGLYEHEELAILGGKLERLGNNYFSFRNFNETMELRVPENEKAEFGIQFRARREESPGKESKKGKRKGKGKVSPKSVDTTTVLQKSDYRYVGMFQLIFGSSTIVQDIVMICSLK